MADKPADSFTVKFTRARTVEYCDSLGAIEFGFDIPSAEAKSLILEHHSTRKPRPDRYDVAFERSLRFLESCGYRVGTFGAAQPPPPMRATEVSGLIEAELAGENPLIVADADILKPPRRAVFTDDHKSDWDLWLIVDSKAEVYRGYKIVFDDQSRQFGLATSQSVFVCFWGSFLQTL
jgi:hypothetical protein